MAAKHEMRPDGTKASATEIDRARLWNQAGRARKSNSATNVTASSLVHASGQVSDRFVGVR